MISNIQCLFLLLGRVVVLLDAELQPLHEVLVEVQPIDIAVGTLERNVVPIGRNAAGHARRTYLSDR